METQTTNSISKSRSRIIAGLLLLILLLYFCYSSTKWYWQRSALNEIATIQEAFQGDAGRYNLGLSGDDGINGMLGVLVQMPRISAPAANVAKAAALDPIKYTSTKPTVLLANENDRLVWPGQTSAYVAERNAKFAPTLAAYESVLSAYVTAALAFAIFLS